MRKFLLAAALLALGFPAHAQTVTRYVSTGYCQVTSLGSATDLNNTSVCTGGVPIGSQIAEICVETASVRYRDDGTAPTASVGILVAPISSTIPTCFQYSGPLTKIQFIAVSGSPVVSVGFYK